MACRLLPGVPLDAEQAWPLVIMWVSSPYEHRASPCLRPSSRMPSCLRQLGKASGPAPLETAADLRKFLATVPDPRARRGVRHPWTAPLTAAAAAVLAGAASITAIGEWVADAP